MDILKELTKEEIVKKQREQHSNKLKKELTVKRKNIRIEDIALLKKHFSDAKSVLCIGNRDDSEVQDFIDAGFDAIGTDVVDETKLTRKIDAYDLDKHFGEDAFDIVFSSHSLEHMADVKKVMKNIKHIAKMGVFIVLPITPGVKPRWKHPTVFEIMKFNSQKETNDIFINTDKYKTIWDDFDSLRPFKLLVGKFRKGLTEPREVFICLGF